MQHQFLKSHKSDYDNTVQCSKYRLHVWGQNRHSSWRIQTEVTMEAEPAASGEMATVELQLWYSYPLEISQTLPPASKLNLLSPVSHKRVYKTNIIYIIVRYLKSWV